MNNKYDLVETHIDYLRRRIKETSDDSYFTNEEIYKALIDARALIIERRLQKGKEFPEYMYQTLCFPLCIDTYSDCNCVPKEYDCKVLKTKNEIPDSFFNGYAEILRISTLSGEEIAQSTEAQARYRKYKKTRVKGLYYISTNKRIAIFNSPGNRLKVVKVRALFIDPVNAVLSAGCSTDDDPCPDPLGTGFGSKQSDNIDMYEIALKTLLTTKQLPEDKTNNSDSTLPEQRY
jgi:hypothetical protein